jgi:hypothetical protein
MALAVSDSPQIQDRELELEQPPEGAVDGGFEQAFETAIVRWLMAGHEHALSVNEEKKKRMARHRRLRQGQWGKQLPGKERLYRPTLAKKINRFLANAVRKIVPNPYNHDWLRMQAVWKGLEVYVEEYEAYLRHKLATAKAESDKSFFRTARRSLDDAATYGSTCGVVPMEMIQGDLNGDQHISASPSPTRLDMFNVWPWHIDVDDITQTNTTVYAPIDDALLDDLDGDLAARIREKLNPISQRSGSGDMDNRALDPDENPNMNLFGDVYDRYIGYVRGFPWREIVKYIDKDFKELAEAKGKDGLIELLAEKYGFDPALAVRASWWTVEVAGDSILISAKPWPIWLPEGEGPLVWYNFFHISGQLWGRSMYDYSEIDERMMNQYHTAAMRVGMMAANPPMTLNEAGLDPVWYSQRGRKLLLAPGDVILTIGESQRPVVEPLKLNSESLPLIDAQADKHEANQTEDTGISGDIEGQSKARTATAAAQNAQQGGITIDDFVRDFQIGWLFPIAVRSFMAQTQGLQFLSQNVDGYYDVAPMGHTEQMLSAAIITPEHVMDLRWVQISVNGLEDDGARVAKFNMLRDWSQMLLQTGRVDIDKIAMEGYKLIGFQDYRSFLAIYADWTPEKAMANLIGAFGRDSLGLLPPEFLRATTGLDMISPAASAMGLPGPGGAAPSPGFPGSPNMEGAPEGDNMGPPGGAVTKFLKGSSREMFEGANL